MPEVTEQSVGTRSQRFSTSQVKGLTIWLIYLAKGLWERKPQRKPTKPDPGKNEVIRSTFQGYVQTKVLKVSTIPDWQNEKGLWNL